MVSRTFTTKPTTTIITATTTIDAIQTLQTVNSNIPSSLPATSTSTSTSLSLQISPTSSIRQPSPEITTERHTSDSRKCGDSNSNSDSGSNSNSGNSERKSPYENLRITATNREYYQEQQQQHQQQHQKKPKQQKAKQNTSSKLLSSTSDSGTNTITNATTTLQQLNNFHYRVEINETNLSNITAKGNISQNNNNNNNNSNNKNINTYKYNDDYTVNDLSNYGNNAKYPTTLSRQTEQQDCHDQIVEETLENYNVNDSNNNKYKVTDATNLSRPLTLPSDDKQSPLLLVQSLSSSTVSPSASPSPSPSPSPITEQISQLFPKCRPKHNNKKNNHNSNCNSTFPRAKESIEFKQNSHESYADYQDTKWKNVPGDNNNSQHYIEYNNINRKSKQQQQPYCKSVNIRKSSATSQAIPSICTESLTSVTARISTNPFLTTNDSDSINNNYYLTKKGVKEEDEEDKLEEKDRINGLQIEEQSLHLYKQLMEENVTNDYCFKADADGGADADADAELEDGQPDGIEDAITEANDDAIVTAPTTTTTTTISGLSSTYFSQTKNDLTYKLEQLKKESFRKRHDYPQQFNGIEMSRKRSSLYERYQYESVQSTIQPAAIETTKSIASSINCTNGNSNNTHNKFDKNNEKAYYHKQRQDQQHEQYQMATNQNNQNPFIKDNYWEVIRKQQPKQQQHNTAPATHTIIKSSDFNGGKAIMEMEPCNTMLRGSHVNTILQQQKQQKHRTRLGGSPNRSRSEYDMSSSPTCDMIRKRNNYNMQQMKNEQKVNLNLDEVQTTHQPQSPIRPPSRPSSISSAAAVATPQFALATAVDIEYHNNYERKNKRDREYYEQHDSALSNSEYTDKYTTAASIRKSMTEQTSIETQRERRERHQSNKQKLQRQMHHLHPLQCQLIENSASSICNNNEDVLYEDRTASWQGIHVTTESSPVHYKSSRRSSNTDYSNNNNSNHIISQYNNNENGGSLTNASNHSNITTNSKHFIEPTSSYNCSTVKQSDFKQNDYAFNTNSNKRNSIETSYRERDYDSHSDYRINAEPRQGIIEYEGSPRRIGKVSNFPPSDDEIVNDVRNRNFPNNQQMNATNASKVTSPKKHGIRPGFPQRIISSLRATTPPIMPLNTTNNNNNNNNTTTKYQLQQQQAGAASLNSQQLAMLDSNAEDTSNDVSEIGTTSTSDLVSAANTIAPNNRYINSIDRNADDKDNCEKTLVVKTRIDDVTATSTSTATTTTGGICIIPVTTVSATATATVTANTTLLSLTSIDATASTVAATTTTTNTAATAATTTILTSIINNPLSSIATKSSTFDYLYEFSETRKVLEEFFKCPSIDDKPIIENSSDVESIDIQYEFHRNLERDIDNDEADSIQVMARADGSSMGYDDIEDDDDDDVDVDVDNTAIVHKDNTNLLDNDNDNEINVEGNDIRNNMRQNDKNNINKEQDIVHNDEDDDDDDTDDLQMPQPQHEERQSSILSQKIKHYSNKNVQQHQRQEHQQPLRNHTQTPTSYLFEYHKNEINGRGEVLDADGDGDGNGDDDGIDNDKNLVRHIENFQRNNYNFQQQQQQQQQEQQETPQQHQSSKSSSINHIYNSQYASNNRHGRTHNNTRRHYTTSPLMRDFDYFLDSASRSSSGEQCDMQQDGLNVNLNRSHNYQFNVNSRSNYQYSPETTDYDSNCGDLDSFSGELNGISTPCSNYTKYYASSMPVLEDGLSSGHTSDTENNNNQQNFLNQQNSSVQQMPPSCGISMLLDLKRGSSHNSNNSMNNSTISTTDDYGPDKKNLMSPKCSPVSSFLHISSSKNGSPLNNLFSNANQDVDGPEVDNHDNINKIIAQSPSSPNRISTNKVFKNIDPDLDSLYSISVFNRNDMVQMTPPPPAPAPHRKPNTSNNESEIHATTSFREFRSSDTNNIISSPTNKSCSKILALNKNGIISNSLIQDQITIKNSTTVIGNGNGNGIGSGNEAETVAGIGTDVGNSTRPLTGINAQLAPLAERIIQHSPSPTISSPVWLSRHLDGKGSANKTLLESPSEPTKHFSGDEEDIDTDLETDRLLGHQRLDDQGYYDENKSWDRKPSRSLLSKISPKEISSNKTRNGYNALLSSTPEIPPPIPPKTQNHIDNKLQNNINGSISSPEHSHHQQTPIKSVEMIANCSAALDSPARSEDSIGLQKNCDHSLPPSRNNSELSQTSVRCTNGADNDLKMDLGNGCRSGSGSGTGSGNGSIIDNGCTTTAVNNNGGSIGSAQESTNTTAAINGEKKIKKMLIEGVLFRAKYLGSTQLVCEGQPTKSTRMMQAEEAVSRIKALAPDGDVQPSTEVDLFISTEKIMVLNTDLKEIMMDHALRTISYIADIGDLVVLMARRRFVPQDIDDGPKPNRTPKMICHVFESDEAQFIAQSIGQAFQVAYMEFLKANGIEDHRFVKEMDYQEVLNSQEIFGDELEIFAKKELQKEVVVPKAKGEILGVVIVESGWGSMLPTVVIANLMSAGAAARCGQLNIGDQLIAINGLSLVGLPLSTCQNYIKNTKNQTVVKFTVVPCPPVVEVKIKRPETKYQLGFSVQNGVICSLLRGGIAERGGVRVGHRIIEINNQSVVAVPHEKIVNLLATSVGEILMKTMPTSMFRLLTGQENPIFI